MAKFYFTYGTDGQPFAGGWTVVEAPDGHAACAAFRAYHPDKTDGLLNCSSVYDEEHFKLTEMCRRGNFGSHCWDRISIKCRRVLTFIGSDSWNRPVYSDAGGRLYVDTDPWKGHPPKICTKLYNVFDGEPDCPVEGDFEFVPERNTWDSTQN